MREYRDSVAGNPSAVLTFYQDLDWMIVSTRMDQNMIEEITLPSGFAMNPDEAEEIAIQPPPTDPAKIAWDEHTCSVLTEEFVDSFRDTSNSMSKNVKKPIVPFT